MQIIFVVGASDHLDSRVQSCTKMDCFFKLYFLPEFLTYKDVTYHIGILKIRAKKVCKILIFVVGPTILKSQQGSTLYTLEIF
jgi:hypothetical protein